MVGSGVPGAAGLRCSCRVWSSGCCGSRVSWLRSESRVLRVSGVAVGPGVLRAAGLGCRCRVLSSACCGSRVSLSGLEFCVLRVPGVAVGS
eukprot:1964636-Pyramimonas_sp.AAC.1